MLIRCLAAEQSRQSGHVFRPDHAGFDATATRRGWAVPPGGIAISLPLTSRSTMAISYSLGRLAGFALANRVLDKLAQRLLIDLLKAIKQLGIGVALRGKVPTVALP